MKVSEEEQLLNSIVIATKDKIRDYIEKYCQSFPESKRVQITQNLKGCCGLAQCISGYCLKDLSLSPKPLATQSLPDYALGHAALTVELSLSGKSKLYLIDPTFIQFCIDGDIASGDILVDCFQDPLSCKNHYQLSSKGFIELTPQLCESYLAFFCRGKSPFPSDQEAFEFLKKPPRHPYHFSRGDGRGTFNRETLSAEGFLIDPSTIVRQRQVSNLLNSRPLSPM